MILLGEVPASWSRMCFVVNFPMAKRRSPRPAPSYHYRATVTSVYDGDTCTVDLDLGLSITLHKQKIRLNRINVPELRGHSQRRGRAARDFLRGVIQEKEVLAANHQGSQRKIRPLPRRDMGETRPPDGERE